MKIIVTPLKTIPRDFIDWLRPYTRLGQWWRPYSWSSDSAGGGLSFMEGDPRKRMEGLSSSWPEPPPRGLTETELAQMRERLGIAPPQPQPARLILLRRSGRLFLPLSLQEGDGQQRLREALRVARCLPSWEKKLPEEVRYQLEEHVQRELEMREICLFAATTQEHPGALYFALAQYEQMCWDIAGGKFKGCAAYRDVRTVIDRGEALVLELLPLRDTAIDRVMELQIRPIWANAVEPWLRMVIPEIMTRWPEARIILDYEYGRRREKVAVGPEGLLACEDAAVSAEELDEWEERSSAVWRWLEDVLTRFNAEVRRKPGSATVQEAMAMAAIQEPKAADATGEGEGGRREYAPVQPGCLTWKMRLIDAMAKAGPNTELTQENMAALLGLSFDRVRELSSEHRGCCAFNWIRQVRYRALLQQ